jgi:hypothetical protein
MGAYLGLGYTYFSCADLDKTSGFNVMLGADFGSGLVGDARYNFLGSDEELMTFGLSYLF